MSEHDCVLLRFLARGRTHEEIDQQLFRSLNTIQFLVKNIYPELLAKRRVQATEKVRKMKSV